jgi:hypothetical protein
MEQLQFHFHAKNATTNQLGACWYSRVERRVLKHYSAGAVVGDAGC